MTTDVKQHWDAVYRDKGERAVSWFQPHLGASLRLLEHAGLTVRSRLIDVGGGASTLVDDLLERGIAHVSVLDVSEAALNVAQRRLGERASEVEWLIADITQARLPPAGFDFWHDRAVLHFLVEESATGAYVRRASAAVREGGYAVIGGFASDGPEKCNALPVARRNPVDIAALFGADFEMIDEAREMHTTPQGSPQPFAYALLRRCGTS